MGYRGMVSLVYRTAKKEGRVRGAQCACAKRTNPNPGRVAAKVLGQRGTNPFARSNEVRAGEPPQFPEGQKDGSGCVSRGTNPFARSGDFPPARGVI